MKTNLFNSTSIEDLYKQREQAALNEVIGYSSHVLIDGNAEQLINQIYKRLALSKVSLKKDDHSRSLYETKEAKITLPDGIVFSDGTLHPVDTVEYTIPFLGSLLAITSFSTGVSKLVFNYMDVHVAAEHGKVIVKITPWKKINGDDEIKKSITNELLRIVSAIEKNLEILNPIIENSNKELEKKIRIAFTEAKVKAEKRKKDHDDLNPFK